MGTVQSDAAWRVALGWALGGLLAFGLGLAGCSERDGDPAQNTGETVVEYTVRAVLTRLPTASEPDMLYARHEAIPEYRTTSGSYGMNVMTMPFPLPSSGVSLEGFSVGDAVEIVFGVTYANEFTELRGYVVRSISRLPEGTALDFRKLEELDGFDPATGRVGENAGADGAP